MTFLHVATCNWRCFEIMNIVVNLCIMKDWSIRNIILERNQNGLATAIMITFYQCFGMFACKLESGWRSFACPDGRTVAILRTFNLHFYMLEPITGRCFEIMNLCFIEAHSSIFIRSPSWRGGLSRGRVNLLGHIWDKEKMSANRK